MPEWKKVYKDYMIEETDLGKAASEILMKNKYYLISNGVRGEVECPDFAYTDKKWILFILNQLILNSVKYKSENQRSIRIFIFTRKGTVMVSG